ncbi:FKBP-type peptidyl-prolyl cis-trans isomerase [Pedobacter punctiformis]|uniref:Peptidyl-prolyl cis-trans isomerase n=1 Tax=Pedobacter punctiformis TaxID=3004097 RepID=A0ABT4LBH3_9SPHI|nr:FKBP-type peptidyl-prolyl cis-trans isomerase [Pedobacter sp. HCMS5-2]MCZ4245254.1 FKBP-type peptidyl-prolyl cis-trans isomerase [Pedobacter sp. HCMS5-2]
MKKYTIALFSLLAAAVLFTSCKKEYESIESVDDTAIQAYIKKNNLNMTKDATGVYYQVVTPGTGDVFANKDSVYFTYQEKSITDATTYYTSPTYGVSGTYFGYMIGTFNGSWGKALIGQKYGAKVRLLIPSHLAYGKNGNTSLNVPSNAILDTYVNTLDFRKQWQLDDYYIQTYLTANKVTAVKDAATGIYTVVTSAGTPGTVITDQTTLVVKYTGRFLNGTVFDSSTDGTFSTTLNNVIKGWGILKNYAPGAKVRLFIPSVLAYGPSGSVDPSTGVATIPANTTLDFDIEIVSATN